MRVFEYFLKHFTPWSGLIQEVNYGIQDITDESAEEETDILPDIPLPQHEGYRVIHTQEILS